MDKTNPLYGVNFGGWLLLERWMTPSLFENTNADDEYTFMQTVNADSKLEQHRQTFITEADFAWLHDNGITAIRLPVGYWALESQDGYLSCANYIDWAFIMAAKYQIQILLDIHALPGSQNGKDHSGKIGPSDWFKNKPNREYSLELLSAFAERYGQHPQHWGLQIINEPKFGLFHFKLRTYYKKAYTQLNKTLKPDAAIVFSDGYTPRLLNGALKGRRAVMDVHLYHMTAVGSQYRTPSWYWKKLARRPRLLQRLMHTQPIIIGEWSGVLRGETIGQLPAQEQLEAFKKYARIQLEQYGGTAGWFYWSYKTEETGPWNFRSQVEQGNIELPQLP